MYLIGQLAVHFDAACDLWCYQQLGGPSLLHLHSVFVPVGMKVSSHRIDSCALHANLPLCYMSLHRVPLGCGWCMH